MQGQSDYQKRAFNWFPWAITSELTVKLNVWIPGFLSVRTLRQHARRNVNGITNYKAFTSGSLSTTCVDSVICEPPHSLGGCLSPSTKKKHTDAFIQVSSRNFLSERRTERAEIS